MPDGGFDISPDEITAHAGKVDQSTALLHSAVEAARSRMDSEDFGLLGVPLAIWCTRVMENATDALVALKAAGDRHAEAVRSWADNHRVTEESVTALFGGDR